MISKGFLEEARQAVLNNIDQLRPKLTERTVLVGIEPSAILGFRDEYKLLVSEEQWDPKLEEQSFLFEEFIQQEWKQGHIKPEQFTEAPLELKVHKHCHQKALGRPSASFDMLNIPTNYTPKLIPSGCCGMAGSFGFEQDKFELSMKIGELRLFPAVRKATSEVEIVANGTSCRHQILDGTGRIAKHPITLLKEALR